MNPLKVLYVMPQIGTGGAERQLYELIVHSRVYSVDMLREIMGKLIIDSGLCNCNA